VLDARTGTGPLSVRATGEIVDELLGHEGKYWADSPVARTLEGAGIRDRVLRQAVALAGLLGAANRADAERVLRRLPDLAEAPALTVGLVVDWLRALYPAAGSSWLGAIEPDLLLEHLVVGLFEGPDPLPETVLHGLGEAAAERALSVLSRALDHFPHAS
jgi:hypothetical protein